MTEKVIPNTLSPCVFNAGVFEISRHALSKNFQDPAFRHEIGNETPLDRSKGKGKESISSDTVTTPASSYLGKTFSGRSSSAAQSDMTTPDTQGSHLGDPNKALPSSPPFMSPLPGPALEHAQLIRAATPSADMSVNNASLSNLTNVVRFFFIGKTHSWKEKCDIHVERDTVSGKSHTNIQCTGKESGIKLRHEGEPNPPCNVAFMIPSLIIPQYGDLPPRIRIRSIQAAILVSNVLSHFWDCKSCTNSLNGRQKKDA